VHGPIDRAGRRLMDLGRNKRLDHELPHKDIGGRQAATGIEGPARIVEALGAGKRPPVRITINGYSYRNTVAVMGGVTFLLQKEMAKVLGFAAWWDGQRRLLANDAAAAFFLKLRNFSQKEGRISLVGSSLGSGKSRRWSYRFAGNADPVPPALLHRDLADCCHEHVAKLARIVLACTDAFPYQACPRPALTPMGVKTLQLSLSDVEESLGFPRGWTEIGDPVSHDRRVYVLREHVDGIDFASLRRLAGWKPKPAPASVTPSSVLSEELLASLVKQLEGSAAGGVRSFIPKWRARQDSNL
jgi:hypothetical protein